MPVYASVCQRITPCLERIQLMPNIHLAYISEYQRISDIFHTQAYASKIRYSVIPPIPTPPSQPAPQLDDFVAASDLVVNLSSVSNELPVAHDGFIVNELFCFVHNQIDAMTQDFLIKLHVCVDFYDKDVIDSAKRLLYTTCPNPDLLGPIHT